MAFGLKLSAFVFLFLSFSPLSFGEVSDSTSITFDLELTAIRLDKKWELKSSRSFEQEVYPRMPGGNIDTDPFRYILTYAFDEGRMLHPEDDFNDVRKGNHTNLNGDPLSKGLYPILRSNIRIAQTLLNRCWVQVQHGSRFDEDGSPKDITFNPYELFLVRFIRTPESHGLKILSFSIINDKHELRVNCSVPDVSGIAHIYDSDAITVGDIKRELGLEFTWLQ